MNVARCVRRCVARLTLVLMMLAGSSSGSFALNTSLLDTASKSIVRVQCGNFVGAAFAWIDSAHALTALHLVASCPANVQVRYERAGLQRSGRVVKSLRAFDLALLEIANHPDVPVLHPATSRPKVNDGLTVLGYPLAVPSMESTPAQVRYGGNRLRDIIPDAVAAQLQSTKSPDPDIEIVNLLSPLTPGDSGGPVLDDRGNVVAIADGGLQRGAGDSSWAIEIGQAGALMSSTEQVAPAAHSSVLYAADAVSTSRKDARCGDVALTYLRTQGLNDLAASSDDPLGFNQLALLPFGIIDKSDFRYDIYSAPHSGAAVAVPAGAVLSPAPFGCTATLAGGGIRVQIWAVAATSTAEAQQDSLRFENQLTGGAPSSLDPTFTYPTVRVLYNGTLTVRRKAAFIMNPADRLPETYAFETLAYARGTFLAVAALRHDPGLRMFQAGQLCGANPRAANCSPTLSFFTTWALTALGVHLTTFSTI